jgi:bifunctional ADP-heptose synthase (sugar kinase/adenylyltransferase)
LPESKIIKEYGGGVKKITLIEGFSTTNVIEWVLNKYK